MDGIIVLVVVVLVLFGSTQIPKLARSLGSAQKEFKKGVSEGGTETPTHVTVTVPAPQAVTVPAPQAVTVPASNGTSAAPSPDDRPAAV